MSAPPARPRRRVNLADPTIQAELALTEDGRRCLVLLQRAATATTKPGRRHLVRAAKRAAVRALASRP